MALHSSKLRRDRDIFHVHDLCAVSDNLVQADYKSAEHRAWTSGDKVAGWGLSRSVITTL